ncbi:MAG: pyridoxal phosphate-dependent aminotransferase [Candidatus Aegiribacteria sp.]|nr:pyridoxal phosphate-dependent aminotransferase [Candidatus Aegiribacteria sp.]
MNRFLPSDRMTSIKMPPISAIMRRIAHLRSEGNVIYSMAQAVPWYPPPVPSLEKLADNLNDPSLHRYSPDPGYPSARSAVTEDFRKRRSIDLDPAGELHLTCGASQAFLSALLTATSAGDTVAVLEPYYFDHVFAIKFSDLDLYTIPMIEEDDDWKIPMDELDRVLQKVSALALVNPGNPTGKVICDSNMKRIVEMTENSGTFLILDETYERFVFTGDKWHPWQEKRPRHVMTIGSFSKSLGMPGWRIGYLFGAADLLKQALKVQDSVVICPPSPSQFLLETALMEEDWILKMSEGVKRRLVLCREALSGNRFLSWREAGGAFFTLASYESGMTSQEAAMHILDEYGLGTIPGSAFGPSGEGHLRISFGCLSDEELEPAMEILSGVTFPE